MLKKTVTIKVSVETWNCLNKLRLNPKETFNDVVWRLVLLNGNKKNDNIH